MAQTVCFMNNKGGCGKTTTVVAIAEDWARMNKRVLLIDLDSQSSLTNIITGTDPSVQVWERTIEDAFVGGPEFELPIFNRKKFREEHGQSFSEGAENIDIVPADLGLSNFNEETASRSTREWMLADLLEKYQDRYDFILIDCPPALGLIASNAMVASNHLVIVVNADGMSFNGSKMIASLYEFVISNKRLNPNLLLSGVVVTRYENNNVSKTYLELFNESFGVSMIEPPVRKATKLVQASSFQCSIYDLDPSGKAAQDYHRVASELYVRVMNDKDVRERENSKK